MIKAICYFPRDGGFLSSLVVPGGEEFAGDAIQWLEELIQCQQVLSINTHYSFKQNVLGNSRETRSSPIGRQMTRGIEFVFYSFFELSDRCALVWYSRAIDWTFTWCSIDFITNRSLELSEERFSHLHRQISGECRSAIMLALLLYCISIFVVPLFYRQSIMHHRDRWSASHGCLHLKQNYYVRSLILLPCICRFI